LIHGFQVREDLRHIHIVANAATAPGKPRPTPTPNAILSLVEKPPEPDPDVGLAAEFVDVDEASSDVVVVEDDANELASVSTGTIC
jgi:hypothetical protein